MSAPIVVVTREADAGDSLVAALERHGFRAWHVPAITTAPLPDYQELDTAIAALTATSWLVFTSARAVAAVTARPAWRRLPPDLLGRIGVAVVGDGTRAAAEHAGLRASAISSGSGSADLARAMEATGRGLSGRHIVWPRVEGAQRQWVAQAVAAGARVTAPIAYQILPVAVGDLRELAEAIDSGEVYAVTFCSPSSARAVARAFVNGRLDSLAGRVAVAALGPTTALALSELGAPADIVADAARVESLADQLAALAHTQGERS